MLVTLRVDDEKDWWARQDLNLQPDRYERPALTIELRALVYRQGCLTSLGMIPGDPDHPTPERVITRFILGDSGFDSLDA